jgi:hypothetical protein
MLLLLQQLLLHRMPGTQQLQCHPPSRNLPRHSTTHQVTLHQMLM